MNRYLTEKILRCEEYKPAEHMYPVKLDANESPYLPSNAMRKAIGEAIGAVEIDRYPDPAATELVRAFASYIGVDACDVVAGNGSDELINVICSAFLNCGDRMLVTSPDFSMYAFYADIIGAEVITYPKQNGYDIDFHEMLDWIEKKRIKLVFLSNPCNPTGIAYPADVIEDFVSRAPCPVVIDEAYMEFCVKEASMLGRYRKHENLIILKTLSKAVGLAALRVGFAVAVNDLSAAIRKMKSPYNVNAFSQAAAKICLSFVDEIAANTERMRTNTRRMYDFFSAHADLWGYSIRESDCNFVLLHFADTERASAVFEGLKEQGIIVRFMGSRLRISVGTDQETDQLLCAFENLM